MKLSNETLFILRNFANINSGIWISSGNNLSTITKSKNILAMAKVPDTFPSDFGIYDLSNFLSVLSLHKESPELDFDSHHVIIQGFGGKSKIKYRYTDKSMIDVPPSKAIKLPSLDVQFTLEEEQFLWIVNAAKVLQSTEIVVSSDGKTGVLLKTLRVKDDSSNEEQLEIGDSSMCNGSAYDMVFSFENFNKIVPGTYKVTLSKSKISYLENTKIDLQYYIALSSNSHYDE